MKQVLLAVVGFLLLEIYFHASTQLISNPAGKFLALLFFFPFAFYIARLNGLKGFRGLGLTRGIKSFQFFLFSFAIGFGCWALMYFLYWQTGKYELTGIKTGLEARGILIQISVGFFLGSLINDLITRGYIFNTLTGKVPPLFIAVISVMVYALDDLLIGGFTLLNFVFSIILGSALFYAFYRTGSLWAATGIHFGLNMAYGLLYGIGGTIGSGLFTGKEQSADDLANSLILLSASMLLLTAVRFCYRRDNRRSRRMQAIPEQ